jgi:hypothetical protein
VIDGSLEEYSVANIVLKTIITFFMWAKVLYFLRIFQAFAYLIRMIIQVVADMKIFMMILVITIFTFADAFYGISRENPPGDRFANDFWDALRYSYLISQGDWDAYDSIGSKVRPLVMVLFVSATIFQLIVMMNLLIAIISETFAEVNDNMGKFNYQEKASLIAENSYLVPMSVQKKICDHGSFLIIANEIDNAEETEGLQTNVEGLKTKVEKLSTSQKKMEKDIENKLVDVFGEIDQKTSLTPQISQKKSKKRTKDEVLQGLTVEEKRLIGLN